MSNAFLYGGDYNPEQWLERPDLLEEDIRMMKKAGMNEATVGVFSWSTLEPREDEFHFKWLEHVTDRLYENGISVIMATPSGARPRWLAEKYPEVLRTLPDGTRMQFGGRHNHCLTSKAYRERVRIIDKKLAEHFGKHPAVLYWHISNEFSGACYCKHCREAFREFLKKKYKSIDRLNHAWWTAFWSHTYHSFDEVAPPSEYGENETNGLILDWKRFVTEQTADFMQAEVGALRAGGAAQPATTNMMYDFDGLDYEKLSKTEDIVSWDSYPEWGHTEGDLEQAFKQGLSHDCMRSYKDKPFLLMESSPSATNWQKVSKLKRPGLLTCASLQAVGHGADSVQFFQIRQSRGASEKFHGALIDHTGRDDTRVFGETSEVGKILRCIRETAGSRTRAGAAIIYDTQNRWALEASQGPRNCGIGYTEFVNKLYRSLKKCGVDVDIIDQDHSYEPYRLLVLPMLYSIRNDNEKRIRSFVEEGGCAIASFLTSVTDENDLCFLGDTPHDLTDVFGVRRLEIDGLYDGEKNSMVPVPERLPYPGTYSCDTLCELVRLEGADDLMQYGDAFYQGMPALTKNMFGKGTAYYFCTNPSQPFLDRYMRDIVSEQNIHAVLPNVPEGVDVQSREKDGYRYVFMENFSDQTCRVKKDRNVTVLYGDEDILKPYSAAVWKIRI